MKPVPVQFVQVSPNDGRHMLTDDSATLWIDACPSGIYTYIGQHGRCLHSRKTVREIVARYYPGSTWKVLRLADASKADAERAHARYCLPVQEIDRATFCEMRDVLPPEYCRSGPGWNAFRMCEYTARNITGHYVELRGRFFTAKRPAAFDDYAGLLAEIAATFNP